jgi:hypothetical protein
MRSAASPASAAITKPQTTDKDANRTFFDLVTGLGYPPTTTLHSEVRRAEPNDHRGGAEDAEERLLNQAISELCVSFENTWCGTTIHGRKPPGSVIPAKAGIQAEFGPEQTWIPACAGMTNPETSRTSSEIPPFSFPPGASVRS